MKREKKGISMTQHNIHDPRKQYPTISPPEQTQPEPGLDSKLQPKADHGEDSYVGSDRLHGRKALITGGDSGIGRAVAIAYAREGADVAIAYLPSEQSDADQVVAQIERAGQKAVALPVDLAEGEKAVKDMVERAAKALGGLDILVNNAGKQVYCKEFTDISADQLTTTFTVNVFAMFWASQAALEHMRPGAVVINTSSIQAYQPSVGLLDYAATKAVGVNFTKGLSEQLAPQGIRVNGVAPGPIWTPLQPSFGQPMEKLTKFGQDTPLGRAGQPAELAPTYVFLASQESSYISGEVIAVTGGRLT